MDIRAILLVGAPDNSTPVEKVSGIPIAYLDVLGVPVIQRVLQRLRHHGISKATLVTEAVSEAELFNLAATVDSDLSRVEASGDEFWDAAENTFNQYAAEGADLVVALRIGPYIEVDFEEMIQHHLDHRCVISMAVDGQGSSLDNFVLDPSGRFDARILFQSHLQHLRKDCKP